MIRRSIAFSLIDKYAGIVLGLGTMAIVSRILSPEEVGLFMVASAAVILIEAFRDFGVGACIIQAPKLTPELVRTAFTVMALLSAVFAALLWLGAAPLAAFYGDPRLTGMIHIATLGFIAAPVSNPLLSLMRRDLAFSRVAVVSITAATANAMVTIVLAIMGFGAASFVWASVAAAAVMATGAIIMRPEPWVFRPTLREWRHVLPFGAWSSVVTLLGLLFDYMPRFILGRVISIAAVGLYSRALSICQLPDRALLSAVQPVVLPALSARARDGGDMKEPYFLGLASITALQWPALICLALLAEPIVRLLLGPQWTETVPLIRILSLASLCLFPSYLTYPVLVAVGRVRDLATASLIALPLSMAIMLGAAHFGLTAVALSLFVTAPLQVGVGVHFVRRHIPFGWGEFVRALRPSAVATLGAAAVPAALLAASGGTLGLGAMAVAVVGSAIGWLAALRFGRHPLDPEVRLVVAKLGSMIARRRLRA
ncbi:O-antigen/teichoic acid export membrane protein [Amaricoccus macauensis]|uniref:O-antigen/teichoic acid export membrane protein n=1 Tax=Amaricoccus macauensis TaxID=57001 RepID=A0A840SJN4_9RHOB|nr:lipopolysaccharide biosynthesis protein [Amaricoccus macauensis]MBB5222127.1 O-antigen/teichoic acid export membrane protein [Amaricoccus macauensis]